MLSLYDLDCLQNFFDFYLTGSIFSTHDFLTLGGLKPSIKITFWYEWLLRATNKGKLVYVVPKIGYKHYLGRPNSLVQSARETMSEKESQWWFEVAKKEYFYKEERSADHYINTKTPVEGTCDKCLSKAKEEAGKLCDSITAEINAILDDASK